MGTETEVIEHTVVVADATVTKFGFGIPLIAATHNYWPELVRTFASAAEMALPPFNVPTSSKLYKTAQTLKSQGTSPPSFKVGKLTGTFTQVVRLIPAPPTVANTRYTVTVDATAVVVTASPPQTVGDVCLALITALNAITDITATGTTDVTVTGDTQNVVHSFTNVSPTLTVADESTAPSVAPLDDLIKIRQADGDWYALLMLTPGIAPILSAAEWTEAERAVYLADSADSAIPSGSTSDVASALKTANRSRSSVWYHPYQGENLASAVVGTMLPKLPGPATWANKGLSGPTMQAYDVSTRNALNGKYANYYLNIKGLGFTRQGRAASGRFLDVTSIIDWFDVQMEDRIISLLRNNDVVPYTASGIELVRAQIHAQILDGISLGLIDGTQPYSATAPALETIDPTLKADRILPDMRYSYRLASAIHKVRVNGTVQV